ncbi:FxSxx-COOH system tetratricopeptide repeat protein [Streptomyces sp. NPDC002889]|uniref:FxSxx-COOH system tetratricopeptide repeat protein n=1 Tax=Streptomyces sp. NPDC002889 TaxID=3364669 RepID=UPI0036B704CE
MISHLVNLLQEGGVGDPGPEELADILWLAQEILPPGPATEDYGPPLDTATSAENGQDAPAETAVPPTASATGTTPSHQGAGPSIHPGGGHTPPFDGPGSGAPVLVPAETALPHTLALTQSLRALSRKVPSDTDFELDEEATVTRLADEGILVPVLRPEPTRWLSLALVVDTSPSMALWQDEVHEVHESLTRLGAFRDIRRWHLSPRDGGSAIELHTSPSVVRAPRHPREVTVPGGRQLVIVLSDMVGAVWRTGAAGRLLLDWARHSQVAVTHLLPASFWRRSGVVPQPASLHIPEPGMPNSQWRFVLPRNHGPGPGSHIPIPVLELEPQPLRAWAEMTAGSGRWTATAALCLAQRPARRGPNTTASARPRTADARESVTAEEAIHRFRVSSSPQSWRLAGYLSALSTVTLPVARLVQRAMLPGSSRGDLAEVLLGGLVRRSDVPTETAASDASGLLRFEFPAEIGNALRYAQRDSEVRTVQALVRDHVSARLETRYGRPRTFTAVLTGVPRPEATVRAAGKAFARPSPAAVEGLGHRAAAGTGIDPRQREGIFISYAGTDRAWAEWVAWHLAEAGHQVMLDVWDRRVGDDLVLRMNQALENATAVVALFSHSYFQWVDGASGELIHVLARKRRFIPFAVEPLAAADIPPVLHALLRKDLHGLDEATARASLIEAVEGVSPPTSAPAFPGSPASEPRRPDTAGLPTVWNVRRRNPDFTGRADVLVKIRETLLSDGRSCVQALQGMGGLGKTQIVLEYAHRFAGQYDTVWWIDAEQADVLPVCYAELAERLGVARVGASAEHNARIALEELRTRDRWLIILDNADQPRAVEPWLPSGPGHVLITSRAPDWQDVAPATRIDVFTRADSLAYLTARLPDLAPEQGDALATALGDLPLALAQAAGVLSSGMTPDRYLRLLTTETSRILQEGSPAAYPHSLAATVNLAVTRLATTHPEAVALLRLSAFLGPEPVPAAWFETARPRLATIPSGSDNLVWPHSGLSSLARSGLARVDRGSFQIHRLTQAILRDRTTEDEAAAIREDVNSLLDAVCPGDPDLPAYWPDWAAFTPHLIASSRTAVDRPGERQMLLQATRYLLKSGQPAAAADLASRRREVWAEALGADHPAALSCAQLHGDALADLGDYAHARGIVEDTLARRQRVLGEDHPDTLHSAGRLGATLNSLGAWAEARRIHEDTLARYRRVLGDDHPDTLRAAHDLANVCNALGDYNDARRIHEDTLARYRRVLGDDHPDTLRATVGLAGVRYALGDYNDARRIYEDTLARYRRVLGDDHPDTLRAAHDLAVTLLTIEVTTDSHASEPTRTLAAALSVFGQYLEARRLQEDPLHVSHDLPEEDRTTPDSARSGALADARTLQEDTLARYRRVLGDDHPDTLRAAHGLAMILRTLREYAAAAQLLEDSRVRSNRALGDDHLLTTRITQTLAQTLMAMGRAFEAQRLLSSKTRRKGRPRR